MSPCEDQIQYILIPKFGLIRKNKTNSLLITYFINKKEAERILNERPKGATLDYKIWIEPIK